MLTQAASLNTVCSPAGQAHVKRWIDEIMPLVSDESDPLGTENFATHRLPLNEAPRAARS